MNLADEVDFDLVAETLAGVGLHGAEDFLGVLLQFADGVGIGGVEGQCNHALLFGEVNLDHAVVVGYLAGFQFAVGLGTAVHGVVVLHLVVGAPDGGEAGGLGGHDLDAIAEVDGEVLDAGAGKFEHFVLDKAIVEGGFHQRDGHIVRTYALAGSAFQPYEYHFGSIDVPGVVEQLLDQLAAAFANAHVAQRTVAGVGVGAENHVAALGHGLASILVDNGLVGGDEDAAILLGSGKTEDMVVLIDGAANGAERVVAVGHCVGEREFGESTGAGGLDDTDVGDIVRNQGVEFNAHLIAFLVRGVVRTENGISNGVFAGLFLGRHACGIHLDFFTV